MDVCGVEPNTGLIEVAVTSDQLERALARDDEFKHMLQRRGRSHLKNSIRSGSGDFIGMLGEEVLYDYYPGQFERTPADNPYHWDLRLINTTHGRIDVKTKSQTYPKPPRAHYFVTVCDKNIHQDCDWYCFVRVHHLCEKAWILGFMPKPLFFSSAQKYLKGELDPTSHNGWCFKEDCWNLAVKDIIAPPASAAELHALQLTHFPEGRSS
jgi:hypothetical protein